MNEFTSLLGIAAALCLSAASPGPSFVMVARTAASSGRTHGLCAAIGMGLGALIFAAASLLGLNTLFLAIPAVYIAFKFIGGLYLVYIGVRIWRGATQTLDTTGHSVSSGSLPQKGYLLLGLATMASNPKAAIVYASVFAAFLPTHPSTQYYFWVVMLVFLIEAGWYVIVATALSAEAPRSTYLRFKKWVDRFAGGIMGALGLILATSANLH